MKSPSGSQCNLKCPRATRSAPDKTQSACQKSAQRGGPSTWSLPHGIFFMVEYQLLCDAMDHSYVDFTFNGIPLVPQKVATHKRFPKVKLSFAFGSYSCCRSKEGTKSERLALPVQESHGFVISWACLQKGVSSSIHVRFVQV